MSWKKTKPNPLDPRALLDELMGADRDLSEVQKEKVGPTWRDQGVCKRFLAGCCPPELFNTSNHFKIGTKVIIDAACTLKHSVTLREQFQSSGAPEIDVYQRELLPYLERLCSEANVEVTKALQRVTAYNQANEVPPRIRKLKDEQLTLQSRAQALISEAEKAGNQGDVDLAATCTADAEGLSRQIHALESQIESEKATAKAADAGSLQTVCIVCGSINSLADDGDEKHLQGNRHLTWLQIRAVAADLRKKVTSSGRGTDPLPARERDHKHADRDRGKDGEKTPRERERERSRERSRERDGGGGDRRGEREEREKEKKYDRHRDDDRRSAGGSSRREEYGNRERERERESDRRRNR